MYIYIYTYIIVLVYIYVYIYITYIHIQESKSTSKKWASWLNETMKEKKNANEDREMTNNRKDLTNEQGWLKPFCNMFFEIQGNLLRDGDFWMAIPYSWRLQSSLQLSSAVQSGAPGMLIHLGSLGKSWKLCWHAASKCSAIFFSNSWSNGEALPGPARIQNVGQQYTDGLG